MREIINLSLPKSLAQSVKNIVEEGQYASKSEFFRELLRMWLEGKMLSGLVESRKELANGRGKTLKSLKALR
ncbi:MAG: ribbon-helix-helix domain-containing protein [Candidatus Pacebacteria bacterium]|nr:ribbon-helix-helix domain-containing protein [Candidatus Paceibacterota bacterium]